MPRAAPAATSEGQCRPAEIRLRPVRQASKSITAPNAADNRKAVSARTKALEVWLDGKDRAPGGFVDQGPDGIAGIWPRPVDQPPEDVGAEKGQGRGEDCAQKAPGNAVPPEQDQQFCPIDAEENRRQQFDGPFPERFPAGRFPPEGQQPVILPFGHPSTAVRMSGTAVTV